MSLPHRAIALKVVQDIGSENLIFANNNFWAWTKDDKGKPKGVWEIIDDRLIKQKVLQHVPEITAGTLSSITDLIKTEQFKRDFIFDREVDTINCLNGQLRLTPTNITLEPHCRESYRTSQIPIAYDPNAKSPHFLTFLHEIFQVDEDRGNKQLCLVEMMGYSLIATAIHQKAMVMVGSGANGKSVLLGVLDGLCGKKNIAAVQPRDFENTFKLAHLQNKLANIVTELEENGSISENIFKAIISGDPITCSKKYGAEFEFNPYCTLWFSTNHLPHIKDFSDAVFRRALVLQFNEKFEGDTADPYLTKKLLEEIPGILLLCLQAYQGVLERKGVFTEPTSSRKVKSEWQLGSDQVAQFVEETCNIFEKGTTFYGQGFVTSKEMYEKYKEWALEFGIKTQYQLGRNQFLERMNKFVTYNRSGNNRGFSGVGFKIIGEQPQESN